jgi:hypothetical protein
VLINVLGKLCDSFLQKYLVSNIAGVTESGVTESGFTESPSQESPSQDSPSHRVRSHRVTESGGRKKKEERRKKEGTIYFSLFSIPYSLFPIPYSLKIMSNLPPLNTATIWAIINDTIDDDTVKKLLWYHLGYRYDPITDTWTNSEVARTWRDEYPQPPDFIDSRPAIMKLTRSIPQENKQLLKQKLGFKGYKIGEFGPRQTRRATSANWLLSYMLITTGKIE